MGQIAVLEKLQQKYSNLTPEEILARLGAIENVVCQYTNNDFTLPHTKLEGASEGDKILASNEYIKVGDRVLIRNSGDVDEKKQQVIIDNANCGRYKVTATGDGFTKLDKGIHNCNYNRLYKVAYPADVLLGMEKMFDWYEEHNGGLDTAGIASEGISRHSVSYEARTEDNTIGGFPLVIMSFCSLYMRARF